MSYALNFSYLDMKLKEKMQKEKKTVSYDPCFIEKCSYFLMMQKYIYHATRLILLIKNIKLFLI